MKVPLTKPYIGDEEKEAVISTLESGWLVQGPRVAEFERMVCDYTGARFAKATTSCTTALHLALIACGVKAGDEVLVPSFTYIASANAITYSGAKPVFIDIDLKTFNIDTKEVKKYLEESTHKPNKVKGIMPVHLFGLSADMNPIMELAHKHGLLVVEDAACALGSLYRGKHTATFGDAGCLSFHPRKSITTGEGGMMLTNNQDVAKVVEAMRSHGATISDAARHQSGSFLLPEFNMLGYNYRMTDLQGAIGVEQLKKFDSIIDRRIERSQRYYHELRNVEWLELPYVPSDCKHTYQSFVMLVRRTKSMALAELNQFRNEVMARLAEQGIATRQGTHAVHTLGYYRQKYDLREEDYPNSLVADRLSIALPLYPQMTDEEQEYVIEQVKAIKPASGYGIWA